MRLTSSIVHMLVIHVDMAEYVRIDMVDLFAVVCLDLQVKVLPVSARVFFLPVRYFATVFTLINYQ